MTDDGYTLPGSLPPPHPALRFAIAIPARDEAGYVERALEAIADQRDANGSRIPYGDVETIVFANGCRDATAAQARRFGDGGGRTIVHVVEGDLPPDATHVGTARRAAMNAATFRLLELGRTRATIATTDADSVVMPTWVAETERTLESADAVGGRIFPERASLDALPLALARAIATEERYRFAIAHVEALADPLPHDPWPRHGQQFGASFALRASAYVSAGGVPAVPALEDLALYGNLLERDARFCHSLRVRVATSVRFDPRAMGGFGTHLSMLLALAERGRSQHVEPPTLTLARVHARASLRRWWRDGSNAVSPRDRHVSAATFNTTEWEVNETLQESQTFGRAFAAIERTAEARGAFRRPQAFIDVAIERLERYARGDDGARAIERASA